MNTLPLIGSFLGAVAFVLLLHNLHTTHKVLQANTEQCQIVAGLLQQPELRAAVASLPRAPQVTPALPSAGNARPRIISEFIRSLGYKPPGESEPSPLFTHNRHPSYDLVIDVGAYNCKDYTIPGKKAGYAVFSFELNPNNVKLCLKHFADEKFEEGRDFTVITVTPGQLPTVPSPPRLGHIYFFKAGVSHRIGSTAVHQDDVMSQVNQNITSGDIPLVRLDDVVPADSKVFVLKSDTQGHEFGVLSGARQLLARAKIHVMMLEFWPQGAIENGFDSKNLLDLLHEYGFFCFDGGYTVYNYWGRPRAPYEFNDFLKGVKTPLGGWDDLICSRFDS